MNGSYSVNDSTDHEVYAPKIIMVRQMSEVHSQEVNGLDTKMVVQMQMQYKYSADAVTVQMQYECNCNTYTVQM